MTGLRRLLRCRFRAVVVTSLGKAVGQKSGHGQSKEHASIEVHNLYRIKLLPISDQATGFPNRHKPNLFGRVIQISTPVLCMSSLIMPGGPWLLLAKTDGIHLRILHTKELKSIHNSFGTLLPKREVVF